MSGQAKTEADNDEAYVLDDATLEELDNASLESVTNDLTNTMKRPVVLVEDPEESGQGEDETDEAIGYLVPED